MPDACSTDTLIDAAKCYLCLSKTERQAALVYFLAQAVKAAGGTDYTDVNTLRQSIACFSCEPDSVLEAFNVVIAQTMAVDQGFAGGQTTAQVRAAIKCLVCVPMHELNAMEAFLRCKFNPFS